jgi:hypothetical protein
MSDAQMRLDPETFIIQAAESAARSRGASLSESAIEAIISRIRPRLEPVRERPLEPRAQALVQSNTAQFVLFVVNNVMPEPGEIHREHIQAAFLKFKFCDHFPDLFPFCP